MNRIRLPRRTVRLRLTLLYGGLFLLSGAALLVITYLLVADRLPPIMVRICGSPDGSVTSSAQAQCSELAGSTALQQHAIADPATRHRHVVPHLGVGRAWRAAPAA